ncbi:MAG TPA: type II secretion system F family protein [Candidatus Krumholzibacteria bacterium]|jgi:type IV pilus assembly protein PilC|nr:type II secretion system F family protein [Candidatus Krumholzibacteria bacterium]
MSTTFVWKGRTPAGEILSGELAAENKQELINQLRRRRILITSVAPKTAANKEIRLRKPRVTTKELSVFTRQFATMINAGLPLVQCLNILAQQADNPFFKRKITEVMTDVETGMTLAEAMAKHPNIFSRLYANMVEAGESGGVLDNIFARLAVYLEKAEALKRKVKGAMTYPAIVCFVAVGATTFMLLFIIPTFAKMFSDFGGELPTPTKIVLGLSHFMRSWWWLMAGAVVGAVLGVKSYYKKPQGRRTLDRLMLRSPVLGNVIRKASVARFTRTLGTLISSGVPILEGLEITARTAGNAVVEEAILKTRGSISEGNTISEPLKSCDVFPPMVTQMVAVGEETGALDEMLSKIADFYEAEVDAAVEAMTAVIEPAMIIIMGVLVGGMLVAMYLPMFKLVSVISGS